MIKNHNSYPEFVGQTTPPDTCGSSAPPRRPPRHPRRRPRTPLRRTPRPPDPRGHQPTTPGHTNPDPVEGPPRATREFRERPGRELPEREDTSPRSSWGRRPAEPLAYTRVHPDQVVELIVDPKPSTSPLGPTPPPTSGAAPTCTPPTSDTQHYQPNRPSTFTTTPLRTGHKRRCRERSRHQNPRTALASRTSDRRVMTTRRRPAPPARVVGWATSDRGDSPREGAGRCGASGGEPGDGPDRRGGRAGTGWGRPDGHARAHRRTDGVRTVPR